MNIKRLVCALILPCILLVGRTQAAPEKPGVKLTRDNFVSLAWSVTPRTGENRTFDYVADKNSIALLPFRPGGGFGGFGGNPGYSPPVVKPLSVKQFEALVRALQLADDFVQTADGAASKTPSQIYVLTLSDAKNLDRSFAVEGRELSDHLLALVRSKGLAGPNADSPAEPAK